jgi:adenylate cyclase
VSEAGRRELSRRGLLGPEEGWSLAPVAAWLAIEGRRIADPELLVTGLMQRLDAAGARIDRLTFSVATLHPQLLAWSCIWRRGEGTTMFRGGHGTQNSDAYVGSPLQFVREQQRAFRRRLEALGEADHAFLHDMRAAGMSDYAALPMVFGTGTVNVLTVATAAPRGFDDGDLDRLGALANLFAPLVEIIEARRMTLGLLDAFVGPRIGERILQGQVKRGDGDRIEAAFWYSDLRGFTELSESLPAADLLQLLNEYFENCAAAAAARGGEILQFIGDAILIVFEIKRPEDEAEVCESALDAAIDAFASIAVVNHRRRHGVRPRPAPGGGDPRQRRRAQPARLQRGRPGGEQDGAHPGAHQGRRHAAAAVGGIRRAGAPPPAQRGPLRAARRGRLARSVHAGKRALISVLCNRLAAANKNAFNEYVALHS